MNECLGQYLLMKKILVSLLFYFTAACSSIPTKSSNNSLSSEDINRINEIYRIQSVVAKDVWPGFEKAVFRFVMVDETNQWAVNIDPMPEYYIKSNIPSSLSPNVISIGITEPYRDERGQKSTKAPDVIYSAYAKEHTDFHFKHSVYFVKTLNEYHRTGDKQDAETWIHISLHELFHTFQDHYIQYTPDFLTQTSSPLKKILPNDVDHNSFLISELKLLGKAACSDSPKEMKDFLQKSLQVRAKRWAYVYKKFNLSPDNWERFESWAEGTAHYVEHQVMAKYPLYKDGTLLVDDPYFSKFNEYKTENQAKWCARIEAHQKRKYWYTLGFAYSLILDKLVPDWKRGGFDNQLFFDAFFKELGVL